MKLYITLDASPIYRLISFEGESTTVCVTVVLLHLGGQVGFDRKPGNVAFGTLIGECLIKIEWKNTPNWQSYTVKAVSDDALLNGSPRSILCADPSPWLLQELDKVAHNARAVKANDVRARYGQMRRPLIKTIFDDWIHEDNRIDGRVLERLMNTCELLSVLSFSDWGAYLRIFGFVREKALARISEVSTRLGIPIVEVSSELELPTW